MSSASARRAVGLRVRSVGSGTATTSRILAFLIGVFVVSRLVALALGLQFDVGWESLSIQNIDERLLRARLFQSLWYLHGQPPLWNALVGLSMKTGASIWPRIWHLVFLGLGLVELLSLYALLVTVRIPRWPAAALAALFVISPAVLVYENDFFYDYPTLVLLTVAALAAARFVAKPTFWRGFWFFGAAATLVLLRTLFEWPWVLLVVALALVVCRGHRRTVLWSCALPVALVAAVVAKNWIMYGVPSTTTWSGIMLARSAVTALPLSERRQLVAEGKLHRVSLVTPLSPLSSYEAVGIRPAAPTGIALLDERGDKFFPRNLENKTFVRISNLYLRDDLWIIENRPGAYLDSVGRGIGDFFAPATTSAGALNTSKLSGYIRWFDRVVYGRFGPGKEGFFLIALYGLALATGTVIVARRLRPGADPATMAVAFSLLTVLYVGIVGNLAEVGENYRFRLAIDPLALALAAAGVRALVLRARAVGTGRG
jgi:hypothetical protein